MLFCTIKLLALISPLAYIPFAEAPSVKVLESTNEDAFKALAPPVSVNNPK